MSSFQQSGARGGVSFAGVIVLTIASALTGAVAALFVQRYAQRHQLIEVLPAPAPVSQLQGGATAAATAPAGGQDSAPSPLEAVAGPISPARVAELEKLLAADDVIAGDGGDDCPAEFPIKANGRSGIYHWPGAFAYAQTRPTLCFRDAAAAERAGFRPAKR